MAAENQTENIILAIKQTQKLRASVAKVFQNLADGCSVVKSNQSEKHILNEFHETLLTVNNDLRELEKTGSVLNSLSPATPNSVYLSIDPVTDKSCLYSQLLHSYKWSNKVSDLAGYAAQILENTHKIKRTVTTVGNAPAAKKQRRMAPTGHAIPPNMIEKIVAIRGQNYPDLTLSLTYPLGSHAILQITLGRILKAQVALRGMMIEWVNVQGIDEENLDDSQLDLWSKSRYEVFRKVTESATAATLHFYFPHNAEFSFQSYLHWFQRYKTLFSAACVKCGKHYLNGLPPTWRDLRNAEPYHDVCRQ